jgi:DNA polymerase-3 subunit beta
MKFTIDSSILSKLIERVIKFVPARPTIPILANIQLTTTDRGTVLLSGFDLSSGIREEVQTDVLDTGDICVPAQVFSAIIKGMSGQLILEIDGTLMTITSLSGSCEIQCQASDEYPDFVNTDIGEASRCNLDSKMLSQAIKLAASSVSTDESKPILCGVNVHAKDGLLTVAATNGHHLTVVNLPVDESINVPSSTVPVKPMSAIGDSGGLTLIVGETDCIIETDSTVLTCRQYAGTYPQYQMLIPKVFARTLTLDRSKLVDALNLMVSIGNENNVVKFDVTHSKLVTSSDRDGAKGNATIACELTGEDIQMAFNLKYLLSQLKIIPTKDVKLSINGALEPVVIQPVGSDLDLLCLVMPVRIRE